MKEILSILETKKSDKLCLGYLMRLSNTLAGMIAQNIEIALEGRDPKEIYLKLFRHFTVLDCPDYHPQVAVLQNSLMQKIGDKSKFVCCLIDDFLARPAKGYSQKSIINFVAQNSQLQFNDFLSEALKHYGCHEIDKAEVKSPEDINAMLKEDPGINDKLTQNAFLAILNILEQLATASLEVGGLVTLIYEFCRKSKRVRKVPFHYALHVLEHALQHASDLNQIHAF